MNEYDSGVNDYSSDQGGACTTFLTWFFFKTWYPCETMKRLTIYGVILAAVFLILGLVQFGCYFSSKQHRQIYMKDGICASKIQGGECEQKIVLKEDFDAPIMMLYVVQNTYINHRRYIDSHSNEQLAGKTIDMTAAKKQCTPFITNQDFNHTVSVSGKPLDPAFISNPCGFMAKLFFNDTFELYSQEGSKILIDETKISNQINKEGVYKSSDLETSWISVQDEHFMIWMQNQALLTKYKLWGRINTPLKAGTYTLRAKNNFHLGSMAIRKGIELVTPNALGGRLLFFPIVFLLISISIIAYIVIMRVRLPKYDQLIDIFNMNSK